MNFFKVLMFLFIVSFAEGIKSTAAPVSQNINSKKSRDLNVNKAAEQKTNRVLTSKDFEDQMWRTQGIILAFNEWPNEEEMVLILEKLKILGLEKTGELPITKVWFLKHTDNKLRSVIEAYSICKKLSKRFSLKYCRPEHIPIPKSEAEPASKSSNNFYNRIRSKPLSADSSCICKSYNKKMYKNEKELRVRCPGKLQTAKDYKESLHPLWAQRTIGADLLQEELKKKPKKNYHFASVLDNHYKPYSNPHGVLVERLFFARRNVDNPFAVLPAVPKNSIISSTHASRTYEYAEEWTASVKDKCGDSDSSSYNECKKKIVPSIINYSGSMETEERYLKLKSELIEKAIYSPVGSEERKKAAERFPEFKKLFESDLNNLDDEGKRQLREAQIYIKMVKRNAHRYDDYGSFKKLAEKGSVIVIAAGNDHPNPVRPIEAKASRDYDAILVGAIMPNGYKANFSQQSPEVHIMAPGERVSAVNNQHNVESVDGTSFAAPLVSGTLASFIWETGYSPSAEEAKILLEKTAIPVSHSNDTPRKNGAGMVNAYKVGKVAKKLAELCGDDPSCFKRAIRTDASYILNDFNSSDIKDLQQNLDNIFPECRLTNCEPDVQRKTISCADQNTLLKSLRKVAFLNPKEKKWWRSLACIYRYNGFSEQSLGALRSYKAIALSEKVGSNVRDFMRCQSDVDCVLIPNESSFAPVTSLGAETFYLESEQFSNNDQWRYCNQKCRCGNEEEVVLDSKRIQYKSVCKGSSCKLEKEEEEISEDSKSEQSPGQDKSSVGKEKFSKPDHSGSGSSAGDKPSGHSVGGQK